MRRAITTGVLLVVGAVSVAAQDAISLDEVVPSSGNQITAGDTVEFRLRVQVDTSDPVGLWAYTNGFRVYSPDSAQWDTTYGRYLPAWPAFGDRRIEHSGIDGVGADTVLFIGEDSAGGFLIEYDDVAWSITIEVPDDPALYGKTICLDTLGDTSGPWTTATWAWYTLLESYVPTWDGPHCFTIGCCVEMGNVDGDNGVNVNDLVYLVDYLFRGGSPPPCPAEANIDGANGINVADLTFLVDYLFRGGGPPLPCP